MKWENEKNVKKENKYGRRVTWDSFSARKKGFNVVRWHNPRKLIQKEWEMREGPEKNPKAED